MNTLFCYFMLSFFATGIFYTAASSHAVTIPLSGSAYVHPDGETRVYFVATHTGRLRVQLRGRVSQAGSIVVRLDGGGRDTTVRLGNSSGNILISAGSFEVGETGYHFISLKSAHLPDIPEMILSGPAAEGALCNNSQYKGAPSTHLTYVIPGDSAAAWFYSEVSVPGEADHSPNAYYETNGFDGGYMGIQLNSAKERRVIFSVWSNYNTDDPKKIPAEYAVKLIRKGKGVFTGEFGNEGSGGHSHLVFMWKPGVTYKLLVRAKAAGDHTIYTGWFCGPETHGWRLIAQWDKTKTDGELLSHLYSFVENFGDNGEDYFTARYGNQWICTPAGNWIELTEARFSTTANKVKHPRFDYGAGVVPMDIAGSEVQDWFYMYSGGFKQLNNLAPGQSVRRKAGGVAPAINLAALPEE
jgi:hypothetical protein